MKRLNNKNLTQKIIIAIVITLSFNFVAPTFSHADFGGILLGPIIDLVAALGDSVLDILESFMGKANNSDGRVILADGMGNYEELTVEEYAAKVPAGIGNGMAHVIANQIKKPIPEKPDPNLNYVTVDGSELDRLYSIPTTRYSPDKIFGNEVPGLDANFINPKYTASQNSIAAQLQKTIASWYNALKNLVIVGLLSMLVYVGIRMMLTSIASDKAKYKQMFMDWLIALCLLFFLHYIMSFTMTIVEIITEGIQGGTNINVRINDTSGRTFEYKTNLTGLCRLKLQAPDLTQKLIYLIFYTALVVYSCIFTWKYMKRALTMAFLTLMAPLVTLTYPIDKIGDGKAQAFNMWIKEFVFNALLQPFHLIIYSIFLGSAMQIATENILYAILFLAFMGPAEKILRKFFGFDKTNTANASFMGGFGGAAAFNTVKNLINKGAKGAAAVKSGTAKIRNQSSQLTNPNAPDGSLDPFLIGTGSQEQTAEDKDEVLEKHKSAGLGKNVVQHTSEETGNKAQQLSRKTGEKAETIHEMAARNNEMATKNKKKVHKIKGALGVAKYLGKGALKVGGKAIAATTLGAIGLGMGIAGDDLEDVFKYGLAGTTLGYTTAPAVASGIASRIDSVGSGFKDAYEQGAYGKEEAALRQQARDFESNQEYRDFFAEKMEENTGKRPTRAELNQTMEIASEYNNAGITDIKQINKSMRLEKELQQQLQGSPNISESEAIQNARNQAITIAKIANGVDAKDLRDEKKVEQLRQSFIRQLQTKDSKISNRAATNQANRIIDMVKKQKKVY